MTINANLKTLVQSRIDAATSATPLEDLFNLKMLSRGLDCVETNINNLIQSRLTSFGPDTELKSLLKGAVSVRPYARNVVWKTQTFLTSGTFTRPAKMVGDTAWITASAGGGGGCTYYTENVRGAFGGCWCKDREVKIPQGSTHTVVIGAGGAPGSSGGDTTFGTQLTLKGGSPAMTASESATTNAVKSQSFCDFIKGIGVHPGIFRFATPYSTSVTEGGRNVFSNLYHPPEIVNGYQGIGFFFSGYWNQIMGTGPAAGYFGAPSLTYAPSPSNTGCGGQNGYQSDPGIAGSAGRLDIGWWEYE